MDSIKNFIVGVISLVCVALATYITFHDCGVNLHRDLCVMEEHVVLRGDTLWDKVDPYVPYGVSKEEYLHEVRRVNGGKSLSIIYPGETIVLPVYERRQ